MQILSEKMHTQKKWELNKQTHSANCWSGREKRSCTILQWKTATTVLLRKTHLFEMVSLALCVLCVCCCRFLFFSHYDAFNARRCIGRPKFKHTAQRDRARVYDTYRGKATHKTTREQRTLFQLIIKQWNENVLRCESSAIGNKFACNVAFFSSDAKIPNAYRVCLVAIICTKRT